MRWHRLLGSQRPSVADYVAVTETHERGAGRRKASESPNVGYAPTHRLRRVDGELRMSGKTVVLINAAEPLPNLAFLI